LDYGFGALITDYWFWFVVTGYRTPFPAHQPVVNAA